MTDREGEGMGITRELREYVACWYHTRALVDVADRIDERFSRELTAKQDEVDGLRSDNADLQARLDASIQPPVDADGVPTTIGDTIYWDDGQIGGGRSCDGKVIGIAINGHGVLAPRVSSGREPSVWTHVAPEPPDSQERIDADAEKDACEYFGHGCNGYSCDGCQAGETTGPCNLIMCRDLLRRQRELDGASEQA